MNIEEVRTYIIHKAFVTEGFPFGDNILVFKIAGKMFALLSLDTGNTLNLKCDPVKAIELREQYADIIPGWHMNKRHWNTIIFDGDLSNSLIEEMIDHSYDLVYQSLPKKVRNEWENR